jgi:hypothetical protein
MDDFGQVNVIKSRQLISIQNAAKRSSYTINSGPQFLPDFQAQNDKMMF